ncbi:helix-turn-helix domain-containing protein [Actinoplanes sp. NPDC051859]|uniref:helix-turn-helix domain-containing protein n=1 Tax=Actinoplanes sp. NPDC051859 TaxID=3363909 RepID=UPI00378D48EB
MTQPAFRKAPNLRQRQLGMALRKLREGLGLSADRAAEHLGCAQSKVTRIEQARSSVGRGDLYLLLELYGVNASERESYWALARAGKERAWWDAYRDVIGPGLAEYVAFEASAAEVRTWSLGTIHGLLQTEAYARATFAGGLPRTDDEIDRVVSARLERQKRLHEDLTMWAILDESLLARPIGGGAALREQLDHLLSLPPSVTLQIVPMDSRWHPGLSCAFTLMSFTDYPSVAFLEASYRDTYIDWADDVAGYRLAFDQLMAAGVDPEASRVRIQMARNSIKE